LCARLVADAAYRNLMDAPGQKTDQSILVSGESGAGKTETTKFVMSYLATVARKDAEGTQQSDDHVADRVLESNPILESFGNARTIRNDNSSRFGKFIQMSFDHDGSLVGAQIATYLLEKVRLAQQGAGERNFHVFYQLIAGASEEDRAKWMLPAHPSEAHYTKQSKVYDRRDGVLDADNFARTDVALKAMKFSAQERDDMYAAAAAVLQLGNVTFQGEEAAVSSRDVLDNAAALLCVQPEALAPALCTRTITTMAESFVKKLNEQDACVSRDALAKTVYARLFDWIVRRVNSAIALGEAPAGKPAASKKTNFIAVLDIFGFEVFQTNSFEQLCINYANETLQQQFNQFVFKLEQQEYEREKIAWAFIDFPDNQACLDLIESSKPPGILALLDEQCLFPKGNDESFANKLYEVFASKENALLTVSKAERVQFKFAVKHYAGDVVYSSQGFCYKNKDELRPEALTLMRTSTNALIFALFPDVTAAASSSPSPGASPPGTRKRGGTLQAETVGSQFKTQLANLLKTIRSTSPHYVRCLKPNDQNVCEVFVRGRMVDQLRYGGVLEAVKVARAGYPTRFALKDFVRRYFMLARAASLPAGLPADDAKWPAACRGVVTALGLEEGAAFQVGRTKMFLRKHAYERLESQRSAVLRRSAVRAQAAARMFLARRRYRLQKKSGALLARIARGFIGRRRALRARRLRAATRIQTAARRHAAQAWLRRARACAVMAQAVVRGRRGRKLATQVRRARAATALQCFARRSAARRRFVQQRTAAVCVQAAWRGWLARRQLKRLRVEAKQVGTLQRKVDELQARVKELEHELREARAAPPATAVAALVASPAKMAAAAAHATEERPPATEERPAKRAAATAASAAASERKEVIDLTGASEEDDDDDVVIVSKPAAVDAARAVELEAALAALRAERQTDAAKQRETDKRVAQLENELEIRSRHVTSLEGKVAELEEERDSLTALVTANPDDDDKVGQLAQSLYQVEKDRNRIAEERDSLVAVVTAEDELAHDRDRLQVLLAKAEQRLASVPDIAKLELRIEELEGANAALRQSLSETHDAETNGNGGAMAAMAMTAGSTSPASQQQQQRKQSAASKLFDKLSPMVPTREGQLLAQIRQLQRDREESEASRLKAVKQVMDAANESNDKDNVIHQLKREVLNLKEKADAMDELTQQTSEVKIKLARRLEVLILENKALKHSVAELNDQLEATKGISALLNAELQAKESTPSSPLEEREEIAQNT